MHGNAGFFLGPFSALKMEVTRSSKMSANVQWTTWRYISEDETPHNPRCENLKSYNIMNCLKLKRISKEVAGIINYQHTTKKLCYAPSKLTQTVTLLTCIQKIWFESQPRQ
jgi:hypothetical protein